MHAAAFRAIMREPPCRGDSRDLSMQVAPLRPPLPSAPLATQEIYACRFQISRLYEFNVECDTLSRGQPGGTLRRRPFCPNHRLRPEHFRRGSTRPPWRSARPIRDSRAPLRNMSKGSRNSFPAACYSCCFTKWPMFPSPKWDCRCQPLTCFVGPGGPCIAYRTHVRHGASGCPTGTKRGSRRSLMPDIAMVSIIVVDEYRTSLLAQR
jgi:hypothetical protein